MIKSFPLDFDKLALQLYKNDFKKVYPLLVKFFLNIIKLWGYRKMRKTIFATNNAKEIIKK